MVGYVCVRNWYSMDFTVPFSALLSSVGGIMLKRLSSGVIVELLNSQSIAKMITRWILYEGFLFCEEQNLWLSCLAVNCRLLKESSFFFSWDNAWLHLRIFNEM